MLGIVLTVLAVFLVIVLAFCFSGHTRSPKELPFLEEFNNRKGNLPGQTSRKIHP